ncbi:DsbA family protein [Thermomonospora amylolytica]|uniref:DsbA family protein n=1 Tax=Thermomonospora amylolytica TaxID=1411117 RepID=UPI000E6CC1D9|nr:thioredoxin domain-containing protein [Thermomonospora amylolytica]
MDNDAAKGTARERLAERRAREDRRARRRRTLGIAVGAVAVLAVVGAAATTVLVRGGGEAAAPQGETAPLTRQPDGSVVMARPGVTAPVLEIYEDFQCPACKAMEDATGVTIKQLAAEGEVKVVYRPFSLFRALPEPISGNSLRALNASLCAPADRWLAYHDRLFAEQGPETARGFENDDLIAWGRQVGITGGDFASCVTGGARKAQIDRANDHAARNGVRSTPWLALDGRKLERDAVYTPGGLREAVERAAR